MQNMTGCARQNKPENSPLNHHTRNRKPNPDAACMKCIRRRITDCYITVSIPNL